MESILYVGMDVHKDWIVIVVFREDETEPFIVVKKKNDKQQLRTYFKKLKEKGRLYCCYEAGFSGFYHYHLLVEMGISCIIAAPGLIPRKAGDHIKTDTRDAESLARNLRAGMLTPVHVPTHQDESVRDYLRMRDDFKMDLKRKKQQILSFLSRLGYIYKDGTYWTGAHRRWLKNIDNLLPLQRETLTNYLIAMEELEQKITLIDNRIEEIAKEEQYNSLVGKLMCLKGIGTLTALSLIVEIGDFKRFASAEKFMGYLGLVPSEASSGSHRRQGGLTKAGNIRLRRPLIESAWHYRYYQPSKRLTQRRKGFSPEIVCYADKAGRRLSRKFQRLVFNGKKSQKAVAATARELSGFIWGMATERIA
ncbi:MAG: IS110 family transposase [Spirochaetales bacterium]|nr:IS110 family transposase [Spirochaetales bacterium]